MSDYNSSLPVRSEADVDERLQSKIVDFVDPTSGAKVDDDLLFVKSHLHDATGAAFDEMNPLPVSFFETDTETFNHHKGDAIAKNATTTHTFATPAIFKVKDIYVSGSGKLRAELRIDEAVVAVGFNSTANPQVTWRFQKGLNANDVDVEVVITNLDQQPQDLYSTIVGIEP